MSQPADKAKELLVHYLVGPGRGADPKGHIVVEVGEIVDSLLEAARAEAREIVRDEAHSIAKGAAEGVLAKHEMNTPHGGGRR